MSYFNCNAKFYIAIPSKAESIYSLASISVRDELKQENNHPHISVYLNPTDDLKLMLGEEHPPVVVHERYHDRVGGASAGGPGATAATTCSWLAQYAEAKPLLQVT